MNEQSLQRVNAFLAAASQRTEVGQVLDVTPAEIGRELGFPDALSTARAVRALIARKRLEPAQGSYRLLDARPVDASEKEAVGRKPRKTRTAKAARGTASGSRAASGGAGVASGSRGVVSPVPASRPSTGEFSASLSICCPVVASRASGVSSLRPRVRRGSSGQFLL